MGLIQLRHIFLREIHPRGQMGLQTGQGLFFGGDLSGQRPAQRSIGQRGALSAIRRHQIHDGLGLGQAELAVQEGAAGVLARRGRRSPGLDAAFHQPPGHSAAAVAAQLHHVLAGVAVGCPEKEGDPLIESVLPFQKCSEQGGVALGPGHGPVRVRGAEHPRRHGVALRPRKAHYGNAACPRCCCNGCNGRILHLWSLPLV